MTDTNELIFYFLKRIHHYYPIGLPLSYEHYAGYQELIQILSKKIVSVINNEHHDWLHLIENTKKDWHDHEVLDLAGTQFPCYQLVIPLEEDKRKGLKITSTLVLNLSLLVDYYTIYIYDQYKYTSAIENDPLVPYGIICSGQEYHNDLREQIHSLKLKMNQYFPKHQFVDHRMLFDYKIQGGFAYGGYYGQTGMHVIYDYLFSSHMLNNKYLVAY